MRPSIWLLSILTVLVGVWVIWPQRGAGTASETIAPSQSRAAGLIEIPANPTQPESPCLSAPQASILPAPAQSNVQGRVGLYVARFEAGEREFRPSRVIALRSTEIFPLASNYKTAVWFQTMQQVDQGRIRLSERFVVTSANQSLGDYPYDNSSIEELAMRMIMWSDNTATDILHIRAGIGSLQPLADSLKLCNTRLLLPTKAWWTAQAGLGGADFPKDALLSSSLRFAKAKPPERLQIAQRLYQAAEQVAPDRLNRVLKPYWESGNWPRMAQIDRNLQNTSTPLEWARFFWLAFQQNQLSASSNQLFRKVMSKGYGYRRLAVKYSYFGGKSGNTAGVLGFTGYLEAPDGTRYIYIFLSDEVPEIYTLYFERPAFALINRALLALGAEAK